jgi:signal transduction histidine kinase
VAGGPLGSADGLRLSAAQFSDTAAPFTVAAGLGLAIAASLAAAHGGEITIDTAPGQGAAFHLGLPQAETLQENATGSQS